MALDDVVPCMLAAAVYHTEWCLLIHITEGVLYAEKDFTMENHPEIEVPNLEVIKLMQSFVSHGYVKELFAWRHYYWCEGCLRRRAVVVVCQHGQQGGMGPNILFLRTHRIPHTLSLVPHDPHPQSHSLCVFTSVPPPLFPQRFLLDEGVEYLRTYLNLPAEVVPDTQKKKHQALERRPREFGDRPPRRFEGGDRDGYRRGGFGRGGGGGFGGADKVRVVVVVMRTMCCSFPCIPVCMHIICVRSSHQPVQQR